MITDAEEKGLIIPGVVGNSTFWSISFVVPREIAWVFYLPSPHYLILYSIGMLILYCRIQKDVLAAIFFLEHCIRILSNVNCDGLPVHIRWLLRTWDYKFIF